MALKLIGEVALDGSGFQRGLTGLNASVGSFKNQLAAAFGTFAIGNLVKGTVEWASRLQDSADALGVNVEFLQKLENGAKLAGAELGSVSKFILEMNKSRQEALENPNGKNAAAFGRLGISTGQLSSLSTQGFFQQILAAFKNGATSQLTNDVQEVGGKSARNLIAAFATQFQSDIPTVSADMVEQLDNLGDSLTNLKTTLMVGIAPAIVFVVDKLRGFIGWLQQVGAFVGGVIGHTLTNGFSGQAGDAFTAGGRAAVEEEQRQALQKLAISGARAAAKSARTARENAGLEFSPIQLSSPGRPRGGGGLGPTDALLSVGNFLGSGSGLINSVAEQHLRIAQEQLTVTKTHTAVLNKIAENQRLTDRGFAGLDFP